MSRIHLTIKNIAGTVLLVAAMFSFTACNGDRPKPFLNQRQMRDLMCDIRLAEAHLYQTREKKDEANRVMIDRSLDVYVPIFQKYGIDYTQYQAIEDYYMHRPAKMERIMRAAAEKLKGMKEEMAVANDKGAVSENE
ncbi:MAG: DUF4296 domain-containing protein [Bacteroides sp.]|nr:DUF4296 domain-containing protein [Bacteroides sp.]